MPGKENVVTDQYTITPKQALAVVEAAGVEDAAKLIRDHAAAGLIRSYAQLQVTIGLDDDRQELRGGRVQPATWERIIAAAAAPDVWSGGTVRLPGSDLIGGPSAIHVTGISFHPGDIDRLANQQKPRVPRPRDSRHIAEKCGEVTKSVELTPALKPTKRRGADPTAIPLGAILCTIRQAGDALGIGRTKVNELMNDGRLARQHIDGGVRIEVASVRALAGIN